MSFVDAPVVLLVSSFAHRDAGRSALEHSREEVDDIVDLKLDRLDDASAVAEPHIGPARVKKFGKPGIAPR